MPPAYSSERGVEMQTHNSIPSTREQFLQDSLLRNADLLATRIYRKWQESAREQHTQTHAVVQGCVVARRVSRQNPCQANVDAQHRSDQLLRGAIIIRRDGKGSPLALPPSPDRASSSISSIISSEDSIEKNSSTEPENVNVRVQHIHKDIKDIKHPVKYLLSSYIPRDMSFRAEYAHRETPREHETDNNEDLFNQPVNDGVVRFAEAGRTLNGQVAYPERTGCVPGTDNHRTLNGQETYPERTTHISSRDDVLELLRGGGIFSPSDVAARLGISAEAARKHLERLVRDGKAEKLSRGQYLARATQEDGISIAEYAEKLGVSYGAAKQQIRRMEARGLAIRAGRGRYHLFPGGRRIVAIVREISHVDTRFGERIRVRLYDESDTRRKHPIHMLVQPQTLLFRALSDALDIQWWDQEYERISVVGRQINVIIAANRRGYQEVAAILSGDGSLLWSKGWRRGRSPEKQDDGADGAAVEDEILDMRVFDEPLSA